MKVRSTSPEVVAQLVTAIEHMIDERVAAAFARLGGRVDEYTSTAPPPGVTRRRFREVCASGAVDGAQKEGAVWRCTRDAWHDARARRPVQPPPAPAPVVDADLEATAVRLLARAGLRVVGPRRGEA